MELVRKRWLKNTDRTTEQAARALLAELGTKAEPNPDDELGPGIDPNYERFLPPSVYSLEENLKIDPEYLRRVFPYVIEGVADAFDSMDHRYGPSPLGSELQDNCAAVRKLVRSFEAPELPPRDVVEEPVLEQ